MIMAVADLYKCITQWKAEYTEALCLLIFIRIIFLIY